MVYFNCHDATLFHIDGLAMRFATQVLVITVCTNDGLVICRAQNGTVPHKTDTTLGLDMSILSVVQ